MARTHLRTQLALALLIRTLSSCSEVPPAKDGAQVQLRGGALSAAGEAEAGAHVRVDPNVPLEHADTQLAPATRTMDFRGRVRTAPGVSVTRFGLRAQRIGGSPDVREWPESEHANGEFELLQLPEGAWEITPLSDGIPLTRPFVARCTYLTPVHFIVYEQVTLHGVVVDPRGAPIGDAKVVLTHLLDGETSVLSASDGRFTLQAHESCTWVSIHAEHARFRDSSQVGVALRTATPESDIRLALKEAGTLTVRRTDATGASPACVFVLDGDHGFRAAPFVDGVATLRQLGVGWNVVRVGVLRDDQLLAYDALVQFLADATTQLDFAPPLDRPVRVRLLPTPFDASAIPPGERIVFPTPPRLQWYPYGACATIERGFRADSQEAWQSWAHANESACEPEWSGVFQNDSSCSFEFQPGEFPQWTAPAPGTYALGIRKWRFDGMGYWSFETFEVPNVELFDLLPQPVNR